MAEKATEAAPIPVGLEEIGQEEKMPEEIALEKIALAEPILQTDLYNPNGAVFQFYSGSAGGSAPGKGAGETLGTDASTEYKELGRIPDWRKKLSNFWVQPFILDGHQWASVEHYYQGSKYKIQNPDFYLQFSLDSKTELSQSPLMATAAGGKTGKSQGVQIRPANMKVDEDFFAPNKRGLKEMETAMQAKFSQNADLHKLLSLTKKAKLQHFTRGVPPIIFNDLMRVRKELPNI